jgi:hypothetical protein
MHVLGLGRLPFEDKQTTINRGGRVEGVLTRRNGWGGACGRTLSHHFGCQTKQNENYEKKIHLALDGHQLTTVHTTTNQKHVGMVE